MALSLFQQGDFTLSSGLRSSFQMEGDTRAMIEGLLRGEALERSEELRALAQQVVDYASSRTDEDIDAWASRLADDICYWTD